jgi:ribose transport system substrate-binding protein
VITIDSDAANSKRLMFVGTDNYKAGMMGAEVAAKQLGGKGNVVVYTIPEQTNLNQRLERVPGGLRASSEHQNCTDCGHEG